MKKDFNKSKSIFSDNTKSNKINAIYFDCDNKHGPLYLRDLEF